MFVDPPWLHRSNSEGAPGRNPRRYYPCLTVEQLCRLPLIDCVADDAVLFLAVPGPQLVIGAYLPLVKAWGLQTDGMGFVWIKLNPRADPANFNRKRPSCRHRPHHKAEAFRDSASLASRIRFPTGTAANELTN